MSAMLTADWCPLGRDTYYRKFELYPLGWDLNFDNICASAAQYGGPIAVIRDKKKFVRVQGAGKPIIHIYSSSGHLISSVMWSSGSIIELGWSVSEELLCVQSDGIVLMYDLFGEYKHAFGMGQEAKENKIVDAKVFNSFSGTGIAVLTSTMHFFLVNSVHEPKIRKVVDIPGTRHRPSSWCVLSEERQSRLLVSRDRDLFILSDAETYEQPIIDISGSYTTITHIVASNDHRSVALLTDTGRLWLGTVNLRDKYCEVDTKWKSPPQQLVWCGSEAVLGLWSGGSLLLVGLDGERLSYAIDEGAWLVSEMDCVRILSRCSHELLQKVPTVVQEVFRINSTEPGSFLLEASRQFQKGSHRSDEYLRIVKDKLKIAVDQCIEAAGFEFQTTTQKMLMKAAQFGKSFLDETSDCDKFVQMCRMLRVLNAVRDYKVGIPLTFIQLEHLRIRVLLDRLVLRKHYYLAIQICKFLELPEAQGSSRILALWACYKVSQVHLQDELVAREIADKLGQAPGVSYTDIATKAIDAHRNQLAIKLMDFEPRAGLQVPLLLRLNEGRTALIKAMDSGNTDLVHLVMQHLREHMPLGEFLLFIRSYPLAQALNLKYCRDHNRETLRYIYEQEDDYAAQASCSIREAYEPKNVSSMELMLNNAAESYRRGKLDTNFSLCEEQAKLLRHQRTLQEKLACSGFLGLSVHDTLRKLLTLKELKLADKLRQEYRIPDRRYWWVRITTLAEQNDWMELEKFSKAKKSPIGYEPFVDVCLDHKNTSEAQKYVSRVTDDLKVKYYVKLDMFAEAAKVAFEQKDISAMDFVHAKCLQKDPEMAGQISALLAQLGPKK